MTQSKNAVSPRSAVPLATPFWLAADKPYIECFNEEAKPSYVIKGQAFPEPFHGRHDAPVVLLLQNPGGGSIEDAPTDLKILAALRKEYGSGLTPGAHMHLLEDSQGPERAWWREICKELFKRVLPKKIATGLLILEFSAYHSKSFGHAALRLPSQEFTFSPSSMDGFIDSIAGKR